MHLGIDFLRILVDSGCQVEAMRPPKCPKTPQVGAQDGSEAAQVMPKTAQERSKIASRVTTRAGNWKVT